jgi:hypothetical protein
MTETPESRARQNIHQLLTAAGWIVQSREAVNLAAGRGIAIREFPLAILIFHILRLQGLGGRIFRDVLDHQTFRLRVNQIIPRPNKSQTSYPIPCLL